MCTWLEFIHELELHELPLHIYGPQQKEFTIALGPQ
jgi:hypothetical protein